MTGDMTLTAQFVRFTKISVDVLPGQYIDLDVTPPFVPTDTIVHPGEWGMSVRTVSQEQHFVGQVPMTAGVGSTEISSVWFKSTDIPSTDWTGYYYTFSVVSSIIVEIPNATLTVNSNGMAVVLGRNAVTLDDLAQFRDIVTCLDIRGAATVSKIPNITNQFTLILGDSVTSYKDTQTDPANVMDSVIIGTGISTFNVTDVQMYDLNGRAISGSALRGHVFAPQMYRAYQEVSVTAISNYYNDATCYAVQGKTLNNSDKDNITFLKSYSSDKLSPWARAFLSACTNQWAASI